MQTESVATNAWSDTKKFVTRFFAVYFVIYIFPFPLKYIQFTQFLNSWYNKLLGYLVSFTGKHIFNIDFPLVATNNGSGDTTYNYVELFLFVVFAFIIVIAWGITDKKLKYYNTILYWIHFYLFYYLALMMIKYGLEKVIKVQFSFPYYSLNETYGESSPMRLLWTFMGYSKTFNFFTGLVEIAAGIFLLFKKTKTFGALLSIAALVNVVVINFSYDVPVKLFATNLLLMAVFVLSPDIKRVYDFFFRNRAVAAVYVRPKFSKQWMKPVFDVVKFAVMVSAIYITTVQIWRKYNISGDAAFNKTPLFGIYTVESFAKEKRQFKNITYRFNNMENIEYYFFKTSFNSNH